MAEILKLSTTEFDRPTVVIDDVPYEMYAPEELSTERMMQQHALRRHYVGFTKPTDDGSFQIKDDLTDEEYEEFLKLSDAGVRLVMVDLPDEVLVTLPTGMKTKIIQAYRDLAKAPGDEKPVSATTN